MCIRDRLSISADNIEATDDRFTMDNLFVGDSYKQLDVYFKKANGDVIKRTYSKGERRNSNQTMPRIACQIFEKQIAALSVEEKENFPLRFADMTDRPLSYGYARIFSKADVK